MSKTIVINFGSGNLNQGFPQITVRLWTQYSQAEQFVGSLPAVPELVESYRIWQVTYRALCSRLVLRLPKDEVEDELEIESGGITQISQLSFKELSQQLQQKINTWLRSEGLLAVERKLRSRLDPTEEIRVILETNDDSVQRLPWHCWDFLRDYPKAEIVLSRPDYQRQELSRPQVPRTRVRILAILGDLEGIDVETEQRFLQTLPNAETEFLVTPSRQEFNQRLWDSSGWDILFFAGHSQSEGQTGRIYINDHPSHNSLTIEQLEEALSAAIENGLKLAIFNSCDGLGLANALGKLHIPGIVVMREPVSNQVAQDFFRYFLTAFGSQHLPLYLAVRQARRQLQGLEDDFPGASWLPVICQNPSVETPYWEEWYTPANLDVVPDRVGSPDRHRWSIRALRPILLFSAIAASIVMGVRYFGGLQSWELQALDGLVRLRPDEPQDNRLLIVTITENDFQLPEQEHRKGSLSDLALARLLAKLTPLKPRAIALDIYHDFPVNSTQTGLASLVRNQDFFAICKANAPVGEEGISPFPGVPKDNQGFSDVVVDSDGILRRHLLAINPGAASPCSTPYALSAQLAFHYLEQEGVSAHYTSEGNLQLGSVNLKQLHNHEGGYQRVDPGGYQLLLNYRHSPVGIAQTVTLQEVLSGHFNLDSVKDRIVLIGVTAPSAGDYFGTPYAKEMPGVVLQAQMVSQLISAVKGGRSLIEVWPLWAEALWIWGWAIIGGALAWRYRSPLIVLVEGMAIGVLCMLCFYLLVKGRWVPIVPSVLSSVGAGGAVIYFMYLDEKKNSS